MCDDCAARIASPEMSDERDSAGASVLTSGFLSETLAYSSTASPDSQEATQAPMPPPVGAGDSVELPVSTKSSASGEPEEEPLIRVGSAGTEAASCAGGSKGGAAGPPRAAGG
uniref:Uncharacterized protein n=1 Tax=Zooxanthella nutricula TaxID=1333877 RepID=A0A7S2QPG2_9DINO